MTFLPSHRATSVFFGAFSAYLIVGQAQDSCNKTFMQKRDNRERNAAVRQRMTS